MKFTAWIPSMLIMAGVFAARADQAPTQKKVFSFVTGVIAYDAMAIEGSRATEHENVYAEIDYEYSTPSVASKVSFYKVGMAEMGDFCQTSINFSGVRKLRLVGEHSHQVIYAKEEEALASGFFSTRDELGAPCARHEYDQFAQNVALRNDYAYVPVSAGVHHYIYLQFFNNLEELLGARSPQVDIKVKQMKDGAVVTHQGDYTLDQIIFDDASIADTNFRWTDSDQAMANNRVEIHRVTQP